MTNLSSRPAHHGGQALLLACGNTLRGDDGIGWRIGRAVEKQPPRGDLTVMFTQQLLPEHAEAVSGADVVVFVDCSGTSAAGTVSNLSLQAAESLPRVITHHLEPAALLRLSLDLYARIPPRAFVVTIGGECFGLTDQLSRSVKAAVPKALLLIRQTLLDQVPQ